MRIRVYVCPTAGCNNYYGSSNMGRLEEQPNRDQQGEVTFHRTRCPSCGEDRVERLAEIVERGDANEAEAASA